MAADLQMNISNKLEVKNVTFAYDSENIIEDINLSLKAGEVVSLLGQSGCGKTTLFNIIAGLLKPQKGRVLLDGEDITGTPGKISYMLQKDLLLPYLTIEDNVSLPLRIKGTKKQKAREIVADNFKIFGLEGTEKKYPSELSGGMRQRAALFRTYMFSNDVCLLDEPFSALDAFTKADMHDWYMSIMEKLKLSSIFITHDYDEAILLSDKVYILNGKPSTIQNSVEILENKPRNKDYLITNEFLEYKKKIISIFN